MQHFHPHPRINSMNLLGFEIPFWLLGLLCVGVAVLFVFVYPDRPVQGLHLLVLRWGHSVVWLFLAAACFVAPTSPALARQLAALGGLTYGAFLVATVTAPKG